MIELSLIVQRTGNRIAIIGAPSRRWESSAVLSWRDTPATHAAAVRELIAKADAELGESLPDDAEQLLLGREPFSMQWAA